MNTISRTLALLKPADLFPAWKWIDMMEECGEIEADEARRWKEGIYGLMVLWGLEADEVVGAQAPNSRPAPLNLILPPNSGRSSRRRAARSSQPLSTNFTVRHYNGPALGVASNVANDRRLCVKRWALGGVLVLASVTAWGMETDPFLGIDVELEDGLPELQGFILEEFRAGVARVNQDASLGNGLCIQVAEQITADLRKDVNRRPFSKLTRVAQWIHQEGKMDVYPPATVKPRKYRRQSIYGTRWYDVLFDVELARAFQAGSIRISADKIGHFLGFGLYYYTTFFEERSTGKSEDEAVRAAIQAGIEAEMAKYGRKWSKVFSVSDLEANYQGFLFYRALCEPAPPDGESGTSTHTLRLVKDADGDRWSLEGQMDLSTFVNPNWDEAFNPSVFGRHWDTGEAEPGRERRFWRAVRRRMHEHCPKLQLPEVRQRLCSYRDYMNRQGISRNMEVMRQLEDARSFPERQQFSIFDVCQASSSCQ